MFIVAACAAALPCGALCANEGFRPEGRYVVVGPVFLRGVYENLNDRRVSKDVARAHIASGQIANRAWLAFQCQIPVGTVMTILGSAPKVWHMPFMADRYFVRLAPDYSHGLDVEIALHIRIDGSLDGLNPDLFARFVPGETLSLPAVPLTIVSCQPVEVPAAGK